MSASERQSRRGRGMVIPCGMGRMPHASRGAGSGPGRPAGTGCYNPRVLPSSSLADWDAFLARSPEAHLLQTSAWGQLKDSFGWSAHRLLSGDAGGLMIARRLAPGMRIGYVPMGPVGAWVPDLIPSLLSVARGMRCFALKLEPDAPDGSPLADQLRTLGFVPSLHAVQPRRSLIVDLTPTEDAILARMHQKTRYNIRLAERKEVRVRPWDDLPAFGAMMQTTAARDQFGVHAPAYYARAYALFHPLQECELLVAEFEGRPLAALMVFAHGPRAWYLYGASTDDERNRMPTYLLQWEAMRWARRRGCQSYDLWGVPDAERETLEAQFETRGDGLWGIYRFKRGFGGELVRSIGAWDYVLQPLVYRLYRAVLARQAEP
jgi:peptidoglycan pentaglycine glycine transferase (the first glycine)